MPITIAGKTAYKVEELAQVVGLSTYTIRDYLRKGQLRGRKVGKFWYILEKDARKVFVNNHGKGKDLPPKK